MAGRSSGILDISYGTLTSDEYVASGNEIITLLQSGYVGIGTTNPQDMLHIQAINPILTVDASAGGSMGRIDLANAGTSKVYHGVSTVANWGGLPTGTAINDGWTRFDGGAYTFTYSATRHVLTMLSSGNVGIGITTPTSPLYVNASTYAGASVIVDRLAAGGVASIAAGPSNPWLMLEGASGTGNVGVNYYSTGDVFLSNGGGNVGIGTGGASYGLDVYGTGRFTGLLTLDAGLTLTGNTTMTGDLTVGGTVTAQEFHAEFVSSSIIYESGSTKFGDTMDDVHWRTGSLYVSGSDHHFFGNVGIGTYTPTTPLHLHSETGTTYQYITNGDGALVNDGSIHGSIVFRGRWYSGSPTLHTTAEIQARHDNTNGNSAGALVFRTNYGATMYDRVTIDKLGYVGIGTTNPVAQFSVSNAGAEGYEIHPALLGTNSNRITNYNRGASTYVSSSTLAAVHTWAIEGTTKMILDSTGWVGIGTTNATYPLSVVSSTGGKSYGTIEIEDSSTDGPFIAFHDPGSKVWSQGVVNSSSDLSI